MRTPAGRGSCSIVTGSGPSRELPRAQRGTTDGGGTPAPRGGGDRRTRQRRQFPVSTIPACASSPLPGTPASGHRPPGTLVRGDRARRQRLRIGAVSVSRLPAPRRARARRVSGTSLRPGRMPRSRSGRRGDSRQPRTLAAALPDRALAVPRVDEGVRGGRPRRVHGDVAAQFIPRPRARSLWSSARRRRAGLPEQAAVEAVAELVAAGMTRRSAVELVSRSTGVARNRLYDRSL